MANRAYVRFWTRETSAEPRAAQLLEQFERLLETVPLSAGRPGFSSLVIRAVKFSEIPVAEHDVRGANASAADVIALAREFGADDTACEVGAYWDLWSRDPDDGTWKLTPEPLLLSCHGSTYDEGVAAESGDFLVDLGFEHFFTGHAGLLGSHGARSAPADPVEAEFLALMLHEEHLHEYYERTRENIQTLLKWVRTAEQSLPIERFQLWSEGEENFEARLDEILAVH